MDIKQRNEISDKIKQYVEQVGLDEILDEILSLAEMSKTTIRQTALKQDAESQHKHQIALVRFETLIDLICIFSGMDATIDLKDFKFNLINNLEV